MELGKFRFRFYEKIGVDGEKRMRTLQKEINGFGRLQEIEELRKKEWADMLKKNSITLLMIAYFFSKIQNFFK